MSTSFCPIDYGFMWTDDWYEFDYQAAHQLARKARDEYAKQAKREGKTVRKYSDKQLITRGGIGTNHPQIEELVTVFYVFEQ